MVPRAGVLVIEGSTWNLCNSLASNSISFIFSDLQGIIRYLQLFS